LPEKLCYYQIAKESDFMDWGLNNEIFRFTEACVEKSTRTILYKLKCLYLYFYHILPTLGVAG